jgi:hypothetical protein
MFMVLFAGMFTERPPPGKPLFSKPLKTNERIFRAARAVMVFWLGLIPV